MNRETEMVRSVCICVEINVANPDPIHAVPIYRIPHTVATMHALAHNLGLLESLVSDSSASDNIAICHAKQIVVC